jgi:ketosteroid isomerase-like protein
MLDRTHHRAQGALSPEETMADAAIAAAIFEAFNRRDIEALLAHLHPDYESTWSHGTMTGLDVAAHEATILDAMPDLAATIVAIHEAADHVIVEVEMAGTQTGPRRVLAGSRSEPRRRRRGGSRERR